MQGSSSLPHPSPLPTGEGIHKQYSQETKTPILRAISIGLALSGFLAFFSLVHALNIPPLKGRINDYAGVMPAVRAQQLEQRLERFENETSHQIAVLTIPSLQGDALESFSIRVAENWKIGKKGFDNGAILLIVRDDRKLRIEVGYGLEGVLPDAIASRIIREVIVPRFRSDDYAGGIEAGVEAILKVAQGEKLPEDSRRRETPSHNGSLIALLLISSLFLPAFITRHIIVPRSRRHGAVVGGTLGGGIGSIAGGLSLFAGTHFGLGVVVFVLLATVLGVLGGLQGNLGTSTAFGRRRSVGWRDPFYTDPDDFRGGRWGGGFGGGDFGGGFSGGGGGFGGGGASGSW